MPLNVRRFCTSVLLVFTFSIFVSAQTSAEIMRDRVAKAKAFIAVRNYNAAIYELENIRRESNDPTVGGVINVLLMNSYLDQGDYKRAQDFLKELINPQKLNKPNAAANYFAVAGQVVKGARNQLDRYKALGLSVSDRNLPLEALTDVEKMRETLELVVEQSKVLGKDKTQTSNAMALLEEATNVRSSLARDDFDAKRWKDSVADAREMLSDSRTVVVNAVDGSTTGPASVNTVAPVNPPPVNSNTPANPTVTAPVFKSVATAATDKPKTEPANSAVSTPVKTETNNNQAKKTEPAPGAETENKDTAKNLPPPSSRDGSAESQNTENKTDAENTANKNEPVAVGSLIEYATQKSNPVYPSTAKNMRMTGIVKVELVVDENGQVAEVQKTTGPSMLQRAASEAVKKWRFKPFKRDGQPTKAFGFVNFNFTL